jgi:hypothetical protein
MTTGCRACGATSGTAFAFCPFCGAAREPDDRPAPPAPASPPAATTAPSPTTTPQSPGVAFDRPGSFYQPIEAAHVEQRSNQGRSVRLDGSGVAPWVTADMPGPGAVAHDPHKLEVAREGAAHAALVILVVLHGPDAVAVHRVTGDLLIGRRPDADLALTDPGVLDRHGWVRLNQAGLAFEPIAPATSFVIARDESEGIAVIGLHALADGDTLLMGSTRLRVIVEPSQAQG